MRQRICVFCGSSPGLRPEYRQGARQLGLALVEKDLGLVYGGGNVGIMGELADTVLGAGGEVIGVVLEPMLGTEFAHPQVDLRVVNSMSQRKVLMADLANGFVALPGGLGTMDEFFEIVTWTQLRMSIKPHGLLNVCQYYDKLIEFLAHAVSQKFVPENHSIVINDNPEQLLEEMMTYREAEVASHLRDMR